MTAYKYESTLSCGCRRIYTPVPTVGCRVYCVRHPDSYTTVLTVAKYVYRTSCEYMKTTGKRCSLATKSFGVDVDTARRRAASHVLRYVTHSVVVYLGDHAVERIQLDGVEPLFENPHQENLVKPLDGVRSGEDSSPQQESFPF